MRHATHRIGARHCPFAKEVAIQAVVLLPVAMQAIIKEFQRAGAAAGVEDVELDRLADQPLFPLTQEAQQMHRFAHHPLPLRRADPEVEADRCTGADPHGPLIRLASHPEVDYPGARYRRINDTDNMGVIATAIFVGRVAKLIVVDILLRIDHLEEAVAIWLRPVERKVDAAQTIRYVDRKALRGAGAGWIAHTTRLEKAALVENLFGILLVDITQAIGQGLRPGVDANLWSGSGGAGVGGHHQAGARFIHGAELAAVAVGNLFQQAVEASAGWTNRHRMHNRITRFNQPFHRRGVIERIDIFHAVAQENDHVGHTVIRRSDCHLPLPLDQALADGGHAAGGQAVDRRFGGVQHGGWP